MTYGIAKFVGLNKRKRDGEMNQVEIDVTQTPGFVLGLCHFQGVLSLVVVVPQLGGDEDVLSLDETFINGTLDALTGFLFILVIVCTIEETIANFDGLT